MFSLNLALQRMKSKRINHVISGIYLHYVSVKTQISSQNTYLSSAQVQQKGIEKTVGNFLINTACLLF